MLLRLSEHFQSTIAFSKICSYFRLTPHSSKWRQNEYLVFVGNINRRSFIIIIMIITTTTNKRTVYDSVSSIANLSGSPSPATRAELNGAELNRFETGVVAERERDNDFPTSSVDQTRGSYTRTHRELGYRKRRRSHLRIPVKPLVMGRKRGKEREIGGL